MMMLRPSATQSTSPSILQALFILPSEFSSQAFSPFCQHLIHKTNQPLNNILGKSTH